MNNVTFKCNHQKVAECLVDRVPLKGETFVTKNNKYTVSEIQNVYSEGFRRIEVVVVLEPLKPKTK